MFLNASAVIEDTCGLKGSFRFSGWPSNGSEPPVSIDILTTSEVPGEDLREMIRVANLVVHKPSPTGKGMSVKLLSKDDFPADCCPTITSYPKHQLSCAMKGN